MNGRMEGVGRRMIDRTGWVSIFQVVVLGLLGGTVLWFGLAMVGEVSGHRVNPARAQGPEPRIFLPIAVRAARLLENRPVEPFAGWRYYTNASMVFDAALDSTTGDVWAAAQAGGAVRWDPATGAYRAFRREHGVASARVYSVAVDRDGAVWMGGNDGRISVRAPDDSWRTFGEEIGLRPDAAPTDISLAPDGSMWVVQEDQLLVHAPDGTWRRLDVPGEPDGFAYAVAVTPDGTAYVAGYDIHTLAPDGSWSTEPLGKVFGMPKIGFDVAVAADGTVAVATQLEVLRKPPGGAWERYDSFSSGLDGMAFSVAFDSAGNLWVGSDEALRVRRVDGQWSAYTEAHELGSGFAWSVVVDPDDVVLAGWSRGLTRLEPGRAPRTFYAEGLLDEYTAAIGFDPAGDTWIANGRYGVSHLSDHELWTHHDLEEVGTEGGPMDMAVDPAGNLWLAFIGEGVRHRDLGGQWTALTTADGLGSDEVLSVHADAAGNVWFGHGEGITEAGEPPGGVSRLAPDGTWRLFTRDDGLVDNTFFDLTTDTAGNAWVGSMDSGVSRIAPDGGVTSFTAETSGLITDTVGALAGAPNGDVWVGTLAGISICAPDGQWRSLTTADGLPSDAIGAIAFGPDGSAWIGTRDAGAARLTPSGEWTYYREADGLLYNAIDTIAVDPGGSVWFSWWTTGISVLMADAIE